MGTELALYQDPFEGDYLEKASALAPKLARTAFVPEAFRNKPEEVLATFLTGHEIGVGPMTALQKINVIKGKPTLSAELMRALVQSRGHEVWTEDMTTTRVILCGQRKGSEHVSKVTWTLDDAKRAKLDAKENWRNYPRAMLLARATGELCRLMFADVLGGISYTPEEVEDGLWDEPAGELAPPAVAGDTGDAPKPITRKAAPAKKAAAAVRAPAAPKAGPGEPPLPALPGEDSGDGDEQIKKRAQMIAMKCAEAGLDDDGRHHLIAAVTNGQKESAKTVTPEEGADVLAALVEIKAGRKTLQQDSHEGNWWVVEVEDATKDDPFDDPDHEPVPEADITAPAEWDSDTWRQYLATKGVTKVELLREAHRLCAENEEYGPAPGAVGDLAGRESLCGVLVGFVEDNADPNREVD